MKLKLIRKFKGETYTIGDLYVNGDLLCNTLEDKDRGLTSSMSKEAIEKIKEKHKTAIPTGTYAIQMGRISPRFKKELPLLLNVPGFEGILIHTGNDEDDTSGCILPGVNSVKGKVTNSKWTFEDPKNPKNLIGLMREAANRKENITIEIV